MTGLIGASFSPGSGGGGSTTGHTPGNNGRATRGNSVEAALSVMAA